MQYYTTEYIGKYKGAICSRTVASLLTKEKTGVLIYMTMESHEILLLWSEIT
jgi:hypothetical protein